MKTVWEPVKASCVGAATGAAVSTTPRTVTDGSVCSLTVVDALVVVGASVVVAARVVEIETVVDGPVVV